MQLTKQEVAFLNDQMMDIYYSLNVEDMTKEGQEIFQNLQTKLAKEAN
jgi:hypothetical protein